MAMRNGSMLLVLVILLQPLAACRATMDSQRAGTDELAGSSWVLSALPDRELVSDAPVTLRFSGDREIVAYCRGPHCVLAFDAVARLRKQGLEARRLEEGFAEWKSAGLPVETGSGS